MTVTRPQQGERTLFLLSQQSPLCAAIAAITATAGKLPSGQMSPPQGVSVIPLPAKPGWFM